MRFTKDRCLSCGTPQRRRAVDSKYSNLDETGRVTFTEYWFCSEECYEKEISKYLEKEYAFDVNADGDQVCIQRPSMRSRIYQGTTKNKHTRGVRLFRSQPDEKSCVGVRALATISP
ncbi:hypothetical protein [Bradyrhizobium niftali]|uniref:Uncharacterized protein n=1 Tax=Bradyrhizobium niftali TaxID=2560055 RepID=A0A4Y9L557_9BRAD|nr:hypothetical protein [Bradyrhizobium niftali]TFV37956.1 hypothetical protein E4K65_42480 [Bradyrhizobium niftali]